MAHVTIMVLKVVDLECYQCYKEVKKVLCNFDQIQDQLYNEKENKVTIKVVCCDPETMEQKILCRGKYVIKSIEIIVPKNPKQDDKPPPTKGDAKPPPTKEDGPPPPQKRAAPPPPPPPQKRAAPPPPPPPPALGVPVPSVPFVPCVPLYPVLVADTCFRRTCCQECHEGRRGGPCFRTCCQECYGGRSGGPCFQGHNYNFGGPPPCYDDRYNGNWGKPVLNYDSFGGVRGNYFQPSQEYCSEPASGCQFM